MIVVQIVLAILLPPLAVALREGLAPHFWANIALTLVAWVPGVIHALYVVLRRGGRSAGGGQARAA